MSFVVGLDGTLKNFLKCLLNGLGVGLKGIAPEAAALCQSIRVYHYLDSIAG